MSIMPVYPANVTFYNFTAIYPADGHCEWKHSDHINPIAEPISMVFGFLTAMQGILGLLKSGKVAEGTRYMFSLLFGYGVSSVGHVATLWNGFEKTGGCLLNLMQAIIIVRLVNTLKFEPFIAIERAAQRHHVGSLLMTVFGLYPIIAHVLGSSYDSPWVSWLTFDLIWLVILLIVATIFIYRKSYPQFPGHEDVFYLIFNATVTCIVAYVFWLADTFHCSKFVASINCYGLWLFFIGLTFYYLTVLDAFLQSRWQGFDPVITRWPKKYIILYVHIQWEHRKPSAKEQ